MTQEQSAVYYFGRFQPPLVKHAEIASKIALSYPKIKLTIGIADNAWGQNRENFLRGAESQVLMEAALNDLNISGISTELVEISLDQSLADNLRFFFEKRRPAKIVVFSGSPSTLQACQMLKQDYALVIFQLSDDDQSGPRARQVRQGLIEGDYSWQQMVTPSVFNYLSRPEIRERIRNLPSGEKRPWAKAILTSR